MHAVALDEAHEMLINKHIKTTIVRPTKEYIDRVLYYSPVRAEAIKHLKGQLFPASLHKHNPLVTILDTSLSAKKAAESVTAIRVCIENADILPIVSENRGLHTISGTQASPEQSHDLS